MQDAWLEVLAETVSGFSSHVGMEHIIYINVMISFLCGMAVNLVV